MLKRARVGKGRSGLSSAAKAPEVPAPPPPPNGSQEIRDPQDLLDFFKTADNAAADRMLAQWRSEAIDDRQQDNDVQRFFNYIGWAKEGPEVLDEKQYKQALQQAGDPQQLYHSDRSRYNVDAQEYANQYFGKSFDFAGNQRGHFVSGGVYGDGTYFASSADESRGYGDKQFRGFLNSNAKPIDVHQLDTRIQSLRQSHPGLGHVLDQMTSGYSMGKSGTSRALNGARSIVAAMLGYNVITTGRFVGYYSVLNRGATTVSSKVKKTTKGRMKDW